MCPHIVSIATESIVIDDDKSYCRFSSLSGICIRDLLTASYILIILMITKLKTN